MQILSNYMVLFDSDDEARQYAGAAADVLLRPPRHQVRAGADHCSDENWELIRELSTRFAEMVALAAGDPGRQGNLVLILLATVTPARVLASAAHHFGVCHVPCVPSRAQA